MEGEPGARRTVDATRDLLALLNLSPMAGIARTPTAAPCEEKNGRKSVRTANPVQTTAIFGVKKGFRRDTADGANPWCG